MKIYQKPKKACFAKASITGSTHNGGRGVKGKTAFQDLCFPGKKMQTFLKPKALKQ